MLAQLLALSSFILATHASKCDVEPTKLPLQDTQILEDVEASYMIGMRATFGSPAQSILMLPWPCVHSFPTAFQRCAVLPHVKNRSSANARVLTGSSITPEYTTNYNPYCDDSIRLKFFGIFVLHGSISREWLLKYVCCSTRQST